MCIRDRSLRELFGQQREQDADFSIHNHTGHPMPSSHYPPQGYMPNPGPAQSDVLGQLFSKAKQNHNGLG